MTEHHAILIDELVRLTIEIRELIEIQKSMAADIAAMRAALVSGQQTLPLFVTVVR